MTQEVRECGQCAKPFPIAEFQRHGRLRKRCVPCHRARRAELYEATGRARYFKLQYGITLEESDAMFEAQGRRCALCRSPEHGGLNWCMDHDHACCPEKSKSCGRCIRGPLCLGCNTSLGHFNDDPELLFRAIEYLSNNLSTRALTQ